MEIKKIINKHTLPVAIFLIIVAFGFSRHSTKGTSNETGQESQQQSQTNKTPAVLPENSDYTELCVSSNESLKKNPSFQDVSMASCGKDNRYIGKQVIWRAMISNYAHTSGIRFWVIDNEHPANSWNEHGHFWGTFLVSPESDPRETAEGLKKWNEKWQSSWINYIMDVYGGIDYKNQPADNIYTVTATINYVTCEKPPGYDGCYIETTVQKIEGVKK